MSYVDEVLLLQMGGWNSPRGRGMQKVEKRWITRNGPECKRGGERCSSVCSGWYGWAVSMSRP